MIIGLVHPTNLGRQLPLTIRGASFLPALYFVPISGEAGPNSRETQSQLPQEEQANQMNDADHLHNFHSHTYRCGHAEGDVADYWRVAMERVCLAKIRTH